MVFIPYPPGYDVEEPPFSGLPQEVDYNRLLTEWFIEQDPTDVVLHRRTAVRTPTGATKYVPDHALDSQRVKFVYGGNTGGGRAGIVRTGDGTERMFSYVMVMKYDADVQPSDFWVDGNGQWWEVEEVLPYNGYETKATVRSYGKDPQNG